MLIVYDSFGNVISVSYYNAEVPKEFIDSLEVVESSPEQFSLCIYDFEVIKQIIEAYNRNAKIQVILENNQPVAIKIDDTNITLS